MKANGRARGAGGTFGQRTGLVALLLFALAIRLTALFMPHNENDEVIYATLADKVSLHPLDYTLRGTSLAEHFPKATYDQPLFLRPPLFVYLLALFRFADRAAGILLPILCGVATIWATYAYGRRRQGESQALTAAALAACCPMLLFSSVRLLPDVLLALLVVLALLCLERAAEGNERRWFVASGLAFGLALLTKETAALVLLAVAVVALRAGLPRRQPGSLVLFAAVAALVAGPWFLYFHHQTGVFVRGTGVTEENIRRFPFVALVVSRPWHFYFTQTLALAPVYVLGFVAMMRRLRQRRELTEVVWVLSYLVALTVVGLCGQGYQTRYILPAVPGLCLLTAEWFQSPRWLPWLVGLFLAAYGFLAGIMNSLPAQPPELSPLHLVLTG